MQENTAEDWNQQSEESGETDTDIYGEDISGAVSESSESIQQESSEENEEISLQGSETDDTATEIEQFSLESRLIHSVTERLNLTVKTPELNILKEDR